MRRTFVSVASPCFSLFFPSRSFFSASRILLFSTRLLLKDIRRGDYGESRRLSFEERSERRMGKTREQKVAKESLLREAEIMVSDDVAEELSAAFSHCFDKANISAMKIMNMAKCLELLELDVGGGRKVVLVKIANIIKLNNATIEITPHNTSFTTAIMQRVPRFDPTLQVSKEMQKIKVIMPPVTTNRRDKAVTEIQSAISVFKQRIKQVRTNAGKVLRDSGLDEGALRELNSQLEEIVNNFTEEKVAELEQLAESVTSMGLDESDANV